jgi:SAM-dependent methyltransferase
LEVGAKHYRAWVGPPRYYDLLGAVQFNFMTSLGLREYHSLLDVGCGSLRGGRLFIAYLQPGKYFGLDPEKWIIEAGVEAHLGPDGVRQKQPTFLYNADFRLSAFERRFDFILAHSIFTHASRHQIATCLAEARKVMTERSLLAATFDESFDGDYDGNGWVYPGIAEYTRNCLEHLASVAGLRAHFVSAKHPWGQTWMVIADPQNQFDVNAVESGAQFAPDNYLAVHKPEERNQRIRSLGQQHDSAAGRESEA